MKYILLLMIAFYLYICNAVYDELKKGNTSEIEAIKHSLLWPWFFMKGG